VLDNQNLVLRTQLVDPVMNPTAALGVSVRGPMMERLVDLLLASLRRLPRAEGAVRLGVPPIVATAVMETVGYVDQFPHLLGTINAFAEDEAAWREARRADEGWAAAYRPADVTALPAACHHVYPLLEARRLGGETTVFDVNAYCYRHERTAEEGRLRSFRMQEFVLAGPAEDVDAAREVWLVDARGWLADLGLAIRAEPATDPFFGPASLLIGEQQRREALKIELVVDGPDGPQAIASSNLHKTHFSAPYDIRAEGDELAHSACMAFGLERIALAVLRRHGLEERNWPTMLSKG
jgi:seryl-tRNA synthetase